ncbi:MAG: hypothetical protein A2Z20_02280 [Bdellovibrionales bacterium RBG_16_40_8]|nr:MAG: hypothetical protein A2Z20_02280 [Bdellovibrionales bacterium RBG_16_40_8]
MVKNVLFVWLTSLLFIACAHTTSNRCQELDWYEIGRQDGANGLESLARRQVKTICQNSDQSLSEALYHNGFDAGVAQFCTTKKGFELGRTGAKLVEVCPVL